jgi:hypothetical protein
MSYSTIFRSSRDSPLGERIVAAVMKAAWGNPMVIETDYAYLVRASSIRANDMIWAVCSSQDIEEAYFYASQSNNPNPGGDESVITDAMILDNVIEKWPIVDIDTGSPGNPPQVVELPSLLPMLPSDYTRP